MSPAIAPIYCLERVSEQGGGGETEEAPSGPHGVEDTELRVHGGEGSWCPRDRVPGKRELRKVRKICLGGLAGHRAELS